MLDSQFDDVIIGDGRKPTAYILVEYTNLGYHAHLQNLKFDNYEVQIIYGQRTENRPSKAWRQYDEMLWASSQYSRILSLYNSRDRSIKSDDVIIVGCPMTFNVSTLRRFLRLNECECKIYAVWPEMPYHRYSNQWIRTDRNKDISDLINIMTQYDHNFVYRRISDTDHRTILKKVSSKSTILRQSTGYPDYDVEIGGYDHRDDIILFLGDSSDESTQFGYFELLKTDFPQWEFIDVSREKLPNKDSIYGLFKRAKIAISFSMTDDNPILFHDAMRFGCTPLLPHVPSYSRYFNSRWLYESTVVQYKNALKSNVWLFSLRRRLLLWDRLMHVMENHGMYYYQCIEDALETRNTFYTNEIKQYIDDQYTLG